MAVKRRFRKASLMIFAAGCLVQANLAQKKTVRVAAAADLQSAVSEIAPAFEAQTGTSVDVAYGSSGNFYAQIQKGAPLDVFFSADNEYPRNAEEPGFAQPPSVALYGIGQIGFW